MRYTVEQVAWDGPNGLEVGWATMRGRRYYGGEILDVYADRELAEAWVEMMNTPSPAIGHDGEFPNRPVSSMGEPCDWETA